MDLDETKCSRAENINDLLKKMDLRCPPKVHIDFNEIEENLKSCIATNLIRLRKSKSVSQGLMAQELNISLSQYKKYESAKELIRVDLAQYISLRYGCPLFKLAEGSSYEPVLNFYDCVKANEKLTYLSKALLDKNFNQLLNGIQIFLDIDKTQWETCSNSGVDHPTFAMAIKECLTETYSIIAVGLKSVRSHFNLSQEEVASRIGVSTCTYQKYESVSAYTKYNILYALRYSAVMGVHPHILMHGSYFVKVRNMQNSRVDTINNLFDRLPKETVSGLEPFIDGMYKYFIRKDGALLFL